MGLPPAASGDDCCPEEFPEDEDGWDELLLGFEQAVRRLDEAEDARLRGACELVGALAGAHIEALGVPALAAAASLEQAAKQRSAFEGQVVQAEQEHKFREAKHDAQKVRSDIALQAHREADDMVRGIADAAERQKREREARRREQKARRDSEAEERQRSRRESAAAAEAAAAAESGAPGAGSGATDGCPGGDAPQPDAPGARPGAGHAGCPGAAKGAPPRAPAAGQGGKRAPPGSAGGDAFAAFQEAWAGFERRLRSGRAEDSDLRLGDVPWPPPEVRSVSGARPEDPLGEKRRKLRAAVLRWHPDKWAPVLCRVRAEDREQVLQKVQGVARRILEEKSKLGV